jgi:hypothetical protein
VLAFEVLDNLPHDCVVRERDAQGAVTPWEEVVVHSAGASLSQQELSQRPLQDALIRSALSAACWHTAGVALPAPRWPAVLRAMLCAMLRVLPRSRSACMQRPL